MSAIQLALLFLPPFSPLSFALLVVFFLLSKNRNELKIHPFKGGFETLFFEDSTNQGLHRGGVANIAEKVV